MTVNPQELEILISGCQKNDRKAQQTMHKLYYGSFMAICLRYTRNEDQAADILQNSFIKIFKNIKKYEGQGSFEGWMKRIVVNTAIDYHRKKKNDFLLLPEDQELEQFEQIDETDDDESEYPYSPADVINAIQKLTPAYRMVFNLYVIEHYQHKEIAEKLGISIGTSKSNLLKAKLKLKKLLLDKITNPAN